MKIALLIHEDVVLSTITGALEMFTQTNRYFHDAGKERPFRLMLAGDRPGNEFLSCFPGRDTEYKTLAEVPALQLLIVPAFLGDTDHILQKHRHLLDWIKEISEKGAEVASLCSGSYWLAEAGILTGKTCTSHWRDIDDLRQRYPNTRFLSDRVITDQDGIYTSGGSFSSLNLVLYLIDKFCGKATGIWASKMFSLDIDRTRQSHFEIFQGQRTHQDEEILKAQAFIEEAYNREISVDQMAGQTTMSKRNFIRRFKNATSNTPLEYLQRVKIEAAKKALEKNSETVTSLMMLAGYNDIKTFRKIFKRITGLTPKDYRKKYCRA